MSSIHLLCCSLIPSCHKHNFSVQTSLVFVFRYFLCVYLHVHCIHITLSTMFLIFVYNPTTLNCGQSRDIYTYTRSLGDQTIQLVSLRSGLVIFHFGCMTFPSAGGRRITDGHTWISKNKFKCDPSVLKFGIQIPGAPSA